jgi:hypothetical protein
VYEGLANLCARKKMVTHYKTTSDIITEALERAFEPIVKHLITVCACGWESVLNPPQRKYSARYLLIAGIIKN